MSDQQRPDGFNSFDPEELAKMLQQMFGGQAGVDPADLAKAAGLPANPAALLGLFQTLTNAANAPASDKVLDLIQVRNAALEALSAKEQTHKAEVERVAAAITGSLTLATAWLDRTTSIGAAADAPKFLDRTKWVTGSIDTWINFATPVADSICNNLDSSLNTQLPAELGQILAGSNSMFRRLGGALFSLQLGHAIGQLATSVFSGGDIGTPVITASGHTGGSFIPENIAKFVQDLEGSASGMVLYLTVRELAHARLFKHAKWLRPHLENAVATYARGIEINTEHLESLAFELDPANPQEFTELLQSGALIPPKTALQEQAHADIGHLLALIEGWVDAVTLEATRDMPEAERFAELMRRRQATGNPAEKVFASLIGLELRPRKLREAAKLWKQISDLGGSQLRDSLWEHPDLLPTIAEVETPARLLERLGFADAAAQPEYDFDAELEKLLQGGFNNSQNHDDNKNITGDTSTDASDVDDDES